MITKCVKSPPSLEGWNARDAHEMLGWRTFERGGARNGARALAQAMYDSMYHQPGIGGPDNLSRLHLRAQSQIDHTRTVRLRIVRITAQGRASMARTLHHFIHTHTHTHFIRTSCSMASRSIEVHFHSTPAPPNTHTDQTWPNCEGKPNLAKLRGKAKLGQTARQPSFQPSFPGNWK